MSTTTIIWLFQVVFIFQPCDSIFYYPGLLNIALNKPIELEPKRLICGTESKVSLCDNRLEKGKSCNQYSNSILYCDQSCPYGTVIRNFDEIEKINLQKLNPCIVADRSYYMKNSIINYSYFFSSSLCNPENNLVWKPFIFNSIANNLFGQRSLSSYHGDENEGFTILLWFQQIGNKNGFVINIFYLLDLKVFFFKHNRSISS
jgi:hypothetical protein